MLHFSQVNLFWMGSLHHIDLHRKQPGGGIMLFIREDIPSNLLKADTCISGIENLLVEIHLRSKKWLISCSYNPHLNSIQKNLAQLSKKFDFYSSKYENLIVIADFNAEMTNTHIEKFCHCILLWKHITPNRILKSYNTEITRTLLTNISGETFYGSHLFKTFSLMNLINLNLLPQDSQILMPH